MVSKLGLVQYGFTLESCDQNKTTLKTCRLLLVFTMLRSTCYLSKIGKSGITDHIHRNYNEID